jgi:hypothetical protein
MGHVSLVASRKRGPAEASSALLLNIAAHPTSKVPNACLLVTLIASIVGLKAFVNSTSRQCCSKPCGGNWIFTEAQFCVLMCRRSGPSIHE